jgi:hypothetical protein
MITNTKAMYEAAQFGNGSAKVLSKPELHAIRLENAATLLRSCMTNPSVLDVGCRLRSDSFNGQHGKRVVCRPKGNLLYAHDRRMAYRLLDRGAAQI